MNIGCNTLWGKLYQTSNSYHGVAFRFRERDFSYDYLKDKIESFASRFTALGIKKDDVVCICSPNVPSAVFAMYALNEIGAINFIVHPLMPAKALEESLVETKAKLLLVFDQRYSIYKDIKVCPIYTISVRRELKPFEEFFYPFVFAKKLRGTRKRDFLSVKPSGDAFTKNEDDLKPSFYLASGGTTGKSKIVILNDRAINFAGEKVEWILGEQYKYCKSSGMLAFLPMFHGFGLAMGVHAPFINKAVSDLMIQYDPNEISYLIKNRKLRYLIVVPYLANRMLNSQIFNPEYVKNITHAFIGGDKPNPAIFKKFDEKMEEGHSICRLLEGYGLTETATVVVVNRLFDNKQGSVGKPLPGIKLKIVDSSGKELGSNNLGEVLISGDAIALGYLNDPETTKKVFVKDENGVVWLHTGDLGYLDEEGFLFLKGREKDMFKIAGFNIFPSDIEEKTNLIPGVINSAAVFIPNTTHPYVHLFVQKERGVSEKKLLKTINKTLSSELIKYAVPEKISFLENLPLTSVGKIDKLKLQKED